MFDHRFFGSREGSWATSAFCAKTSKLGVPSALQQPAAHQAHYKKHSPILSSVPVPQQRLVQQHKGLLFGRR